MRVIGLLSWYAERPSWLTACITSYHQAGIDHLVAIDGAYALYPDARPRSTSPEHAAIIETCNGLNLPLTLVLPSTPWAGNEVEKRTALFRHADAISDPARDWYLVIDADEVVTRAADGWRDYLDDSPYLVAEVTLFERTTHDTPGQAATTAKLDVPAVTQHPIRKLFRARHGIHCAGNHYTYRTPDGRNLWGQTGLELADDMTDQITIEHRSIHRGLSRRQAARDYYDARDKHGIEANHATTSLH